MHDSMSQFKTRDGDVKFAGVQFTVSAVQYTRLVLLTTVLFELGLKKSESGTT